MLRARLVVTLFVFVVAPAMLRAQGQPLGPEFRVNSYTLGTQHEPFVSADAAGNFLVLWESNNQDGGFFGVLGQRFDSAGSPLGGEFRVNTYTTNTQSRPSAAHDSAGNFVVAWRSDGQDGSGWGIFAQRHASTGAPLGEEFRVNTRRRLSQDSSSVASDAVGNFVVVWSGTVNANGIGGIFGQRYDSAGNPLGGEFRVNTHTTYSQGLPSVASDAAGNFVVVWVQFLAQGSEDILAQRYASTGVPLGPEFRVNTFSALTQFWPSVASDSAGNFVVTWYGEIPGGSGFDIAARRFASTGTPLGGEFRVNTNTFSAQWFPAVASDQAGNFVVVWEGYFGQDGNQGGIFGQRYGSTGSPLGAEFRINSYTTHAQGMPSVSADAAGNFVVVWNSYKQDGSGWGIFAQRFNMIQP